jgi:hypothetical protein
MPIDASRLHAAVAAKAPISGLMIGDPSNKASWTIQFSPEATAEQRSAAQGVIAAFDLDAPPVPAQVELWRARVIAKTTPWSGNYGGDGKTLFDAAQAAIAALSPVQRAQASEAWEYTNFLTRNGSIIAALQQVLGMTDEQVDDLFRQAEAIQP